MSRMHEGQSDLNGDPCFLVVCVVVVVVMLFFLAFPAKFRNQPSLIISVSTFHILLLSQSLKISPYATFQRSLSSFLIVLSILRASAVFANNSYHKINLCCR